MGVVEQILSVDEATFVRLQAAGLTKYTYAEVKEALEAYEAVDREATRLFAQAGALLEPYTSSPTDLVAFLSTDTALLKVYERMNSTSFPVLAMGKRGEMYPVADWRKKTAQYRRAVDRLKKALDAEEEAACLACCGLGDGTEAHIGYCAACYGTGSESVRMLGQGIRTEPNDAPETPGYWDTDPTFETFSKLPSQNP